MRYHNITKDDMLNGDGLRVVLWVAGCSHCCKECHNPITWDPNGGLPFDEAAKQEIYEQLDKSYISGITFSGGDPLHSANRLDVRNLMEEIKEKFRTMCFHRREHSLDPARQQHLPPASIPVSLPAPQRRGRQWVTTDRHLCSVISNL